MTKTVSELSDYQAKIEQRLAEALQDVPASREADLLLAGEADTTQMSSRELLQMAWDKAEQELESLQTRLRLLRQRHQTEERALLNRINEKKRLQRELLERAPKQATPG